MTSVLDGVNFGNDSDELTSASRETLQEVARELTRAYRATVRVLAHTDSNGAAEYNQDLSERRARSVEVFLINEGIDPERLSSQGLGESRPIADNATPEGRAANRRVELEWTNEICEQVE